MKNETSSDRIYFFLKILQDYPPPKKCEVSCPIFLRVYMSHPSSCPVLVQVTFWNLFLYLLEFLVSYTLILDHRASTRSTTSGGSQPGVSFEKQFSDSTCTSRGNSMNCLVFVCKILLNWRTEITASFCWPLLVTLSVATARCGGAFDVMVIVILSQLYAWHRHFSMVLHHFFCRAKTFRSFVVLRFWGYCSMMWPCVSALPKRLVVLVPSMYHC